MIENTLTERRIATRATAQSFLNCYLRETGTGEVIEDENEAPPGVSVPFVRCVLPRQKVELDAPLRYLSPTGRHLFHFPLYYRPTGSNGLLELDYATLAALTIKDLELEGGTDEGDELLLRVLDSCRNVERFARARWDDESRLTAFESSFIEAEQALVFGHHLHPTPKSRQGMSERELDAYSPEMEARFPLHYFRAHHSVVSEGSALPKSATTLIKTELRNDHAMSEESKQKYCKDDGHSMVPVHPWQAESLLEEPGAQALIKRGLLEYLGPLGSPYSPTSSIRTAYRREASFMPKLSLGVKITNSVRNNLRKELRRGIKVCRVLDSEIGYELRERFPDFTIIRDPAYITVDTDGENESGFEVVLRENPFRADEDATPVISLCQDNMSDNGSRLSGIVEQLSREEGRPVREVSLEWFRRYLDVSLRPILWLYFAHGIAPEAHQQNSVLELRDGWPRRFYYRDNQGYYFRESARGALERLLPGINEIESDTVVADEVSDERLRYYFFVNNLFGLVNAFGSAGLANEWELLAGLRSVLEELAGTAPEHSELIPSLLEWRKLPAKANLLTRLHDMDELVGDLETQSVYVEIDNPLVEVKS